VNSSYNIPTNALLQQLINLFCCSYMFRRITSSLGSFSVACWVILIGSCSFIGGICWQNPLSVVLAHNCAGDKIEKNEMGGAFSSNGRGERRVQGFWWGNRIYSDWLRAEMSGDRTPVEARFFAHVQTGPGAHPASCTMGTGSFPGVKRPGRDADRTTLWSAEVTKE
jgi:hypothetical protein